jgi:hypothetical protein
VKPACYAVKPACYTVKPAYYTVKAAYYTVKPAYYAVKPANYTFKPVCYADSLPRRRRMLGRPWGQGDAQAVHNPLSCLPFIRVRITNCLYLRVIPRTDALMNTQAWTLGALFALIPFANAGAADNAAQKPTAQRPADDKPADDTQQQVEACKQQQRAEGEKTEVKTAIKCAVKVAFQSRIRRKKEEEPVEMTVGAPPMITDDTDTPGEGNWEINLGLHSEFGGGEHRIEAPTIDINRGFGDTLQLTYEVPYAFVKANDGATGGSRTANGFGDSILGAKYRFYDNNDTGLSFAIYPQLELRTPGASKLVSENASGFILPLMMTREFEHFAIGANLGAEFSGGDQRLFASFGTGRRLTDRTALLAEIAGTNLNDPDEKRVLLNVGFRHKISETQSFSGSLGRDVFAGGGQAKQTYITFAWQMDVGK